MAADCGPFTTEQDLKIFGVDLAETDRFWHPNGSGRPAGVPIRWMLGQDLINQSKVWQLTPQAMHNSAVQGWTHVHTHLGRPNSADQYTQHFPNPGPSPTTTTFTPSFTKMIMHNYTLTKPFAVTMSSGISIPGVDLNIPINASAQEVEASSTSTTQTYSGAHPITIPPGRMVIATSSLVSTTGYSVYQAKVGVCGNVCIQYQNPDFVTIQQDGAAAALAAGGMPKHNVAEIAEHFMRYTMASTFANADIYGNVDSLAMCIAHPSGEPDELLATAAKTSPSVFMTSTPGAVADLSAKIIRLRLNFEKKQPISITSVTGRFCCNFITKMGAIPVHIISLPTLSYEPTEMDVAFSCGRSNMTELELDRVVEESFKAVHWPVRTTLTFVKA